MDGAIWISPIAMEFDETPHGLLDHAKRLVLINVDIAEAGYHCAVVYRDPEVGTEPMDVKLEIYGLDGRRVAVLVDGTRGPGRHEALWEGRDDTGRPVASGVYFARLAVGTESQLKQMLLLR